VRPEDLSARIRKLPDAELLALERSNNTGAEEWKAVTGEIVRRRISAPSAPPAAPAKARVPEGTFVCQQCGHVGAVIMERPGTGCLTLALVWLAILPAIIYSAWRSSHAYPVCRLCGSRAVIPGQSPVGRKQLGY
jgi:hypothetical protein